MISDLEEKQERHRLFWHRERTDRPLVGFTIGSYFPVHRFDAARDHLQENGLILPETMPVDTYLEDYERLYGLSLAADQDLFWVAEPFPGIPWMEAILGCEICGASDSLWTVHWLDDLKNFRTEWISIKMYGFKNIMMPAFSDVLNRKCLVVWGQLVSDEIAEIFAELSPRGLALNLVVETVEEAGSLMEIIKSKSKNWC